MPLTQLDPHSAFAMVLAAVVGACVGSFITLITYRRPRYLKVVAARSQCMEGGHALGPKDLIPILSWAWWRGKCRVCRTKIAARYPLTELACAGGTVSVLLVYGLTLEGLAMAGLWWCVVAIIITDLEHYIILDEIQIASALFGVLHAVAQDVAWYAPLVGMAAGVAIGLAIKYSFLYLRGKDGLGLGDVKFLGVAGVWLIDAEAFVPYLFFSGVMGVVFGLLWTRLTGNERFPFGPALALALLLCVMVPEAPREFWKLYGVVR